MIELLEKLQQTSLALWVAQDIGFSWIDLLHVFSITVVFGSIVVVDLRLLGIPSNQRPFSAVAREMLRWTWLAFVVAVITGVILFTGKAVIYFDNPFFRVKMLMLLLAGINMFVFEYIVVPGPGGG